MKATPEGIGTFALVSLVVIATSLASACGAPLSSDAPHSSEAPSREPMTQPPPSGDPRAAALRPALRPAEGAARSSDEDVLFIDRALRASGTDYTEDGLATYVEWGLTAVVTTTAQAYRLGVSGPRVNAEWELLIDRQSGRVTIEMTATEAEPPDFE